MRSIWIALLLCAAPAAQSQSPIWPLQPEASQQASKPTPTVPHFDLRDLPQGTQTLILPRKHAWNDASIDPKIIRRPDPNAFARYAPRKPIAQHLYPNLRLLPTQTASIEPIPGKFPRFSTEPIPRTWPDLQLQPVNPPVASNPRK